MYCRCSRRGATPETRSKSDDVDVSASTSTLTSSVEKLGTQDSEPEPAVSLAPARAADTVTVTTTMTNWITTMCSEDSLDGADILQMVLLYSRQLSTQSPLNRVCKLQKCDAWRGTGIREHERLTSFLHASATSCIIPDRPHRLPPFPSLFVCFRDHIWNGLFFITPFSMLSQPLMRG